MTTASGPDGGILAGLRVVELSAFVAAPLAGATLAGLGAEVVRIDPLGGSIDAKRWPLHEGKSLYWAGLNGGKRSVAVDFGTAEGRELVTQLVSAAGILVTNLPVRGWNSFETLQQRRPDLIMAILMGNPDGSAAVDYTVNAAVGFPWVTGPENTDGPVNHVLPAWDALAGWMLATGVLAAERHRAATGEGQLVTLTLMDAALSVTSHLGFLAEAQLSDDDRPRIGNAVFGTYSRDFATADGRHVVVVALTPRQWAALVEATGIAEPVQTLEREHGVDLAEEGARFRLRERISALVEEWVGARTFAEVGEAFDVAGVLWGPYQTFSELVARDPRCSTANPLVAEVEQPGIGSYIRTGAPLDFSRVARRSPAPAPLAGRDTRDVIEDWLELERAQIEELVAAGAIA